MMRLHKLAAMGGVLGFIFASGPSWADEACKAAYRAKVQPVFNTSCVSCHQDAAPAGGLSLQRTSAPASLLNVPSKGAKLPRVTPGNPQQSYLFRKISGTHLGAGVGGTGGKMPLGAGLAESDIKAVAAWISGCAAN